MVMGKKYLEKEVRDAESGEVITTPDEFKWMIDELFLLNGVLNIGDSIPWLDWMDLQGYIKRMKKLSKKFDRFLEHVVEEHSERRRREGESFVAKDMVDVLLQFASNPDLEVKLDRVGVKAFTQVSAFFLGLGSYTPILKVVVGQSENKISHRSKQKRKQKY
jgi:hypothetical protein